MTFATFVVEKKEMDMPRLFTRIKHHSDERLIVASPAVDAALCAPAEVMVIEVEEFEAAHHDPAWLAFCREADEYVARTVERELATH